MVHLHLVDSTPRLAIEIPNPTQDDGDSSVVPLNIGGGIGQGHLAGVVGGHDGENGDDDGDDSEGDEGGTETGGPSLSGTTGSLKLESGGLNATPGSGGQKRKRNLPGTPDPDAEVVALSPRTLMATNRFVCEICNKGFQRDQNLQLHRRGHNLPWKLRQRTTKEVKKKVYICPEPTCIHHDPSRALGDLTGIKKHFCRKHGEKKYKCDKCSKRYAVQSDWKAHLKTCGTREYRCDCGTLFSRRDSFITHRAFCDALADSTQNGSKLDSSDVKLQGGVQGMVGSGGFQQALNLPMKFGSSQQDQQGLKVSHQQPPTPGSHQQHHHSQDGQSGGLNLWLGQNTGDNSSGANQTLAAAAALMSQQFLQSVGGSSSLLNAASSKLGLSSRDLTNALSGNSSAALLLQQRAMQALGISPDQSQNQSQDLLHPQSSMGNQHSSQNSLFGKLDGGLIGGPHQSTDQSMSQPSSLLASLLGGNFSNNLLGGSQGMNSVPIGAGNAGGHFDDPSPMHGAGGDSAGHLAGLFGCGFDGNDGGIDNQGSLPPNSPSPPPVAGNFSGGSLQSLLQQALGASGLNVDSSLLAAVTGGPGSNSQSGFLAHAIDNATSQSLMGNAGPMNGQNGGPFSSLANLLSQTMGGNSGNPGPDSGNMSADLLLQQAAQKLVGGNSNGLSFQNGPTVPLPPSPPSNPAGLGGMSSNTSSLLHSALSGLPDNGGGALAALSALFPQGLSSLNTYGLPATGAPPEASQGNFSNGPSNSGGAGGGPASSNGGGNLVSPTGLSSGGGLEFLNGNGGEDGGVSTAGGSLTTSDIGALAGRLLMGVDNNINSASAGGTGNSSGFATLGGMQGLSELLSSMTSNSNMQNLLNQATAAAGGNGGSLLQNVTLQSLANSPGLLGQVGPDSLQQGLNALQRAQSGDFKALGMVTRDFLGLAPNMSPRDLTLAALTASVDGNGFEMQQQGHQTHMQPPGVQQPQMQQQGMQFHHQHPGLL